MSSIVFLIGNFKNGGVARRSTTLANEMAKKGHRIIILVTGECGTLLPALEEGVQVVRLKEFITKNSNEPRIAKDVKRRLHHIVWLKRLRNLLFFLPWFRRSLSNRIDFWKHGERLRSFFLLNPHSVIIAFSMPFVYEAHCASYGLGCPIIFAEKNASQLENPALLSERELATISLKYADACVFQTYDEMAQYSGIPLKCPVVIRNPIRPDLPAPYQGGVRKKVIVNFCRLNPQKNLHLLIDAFEMLHGEYPEYHLEIYGNVVSPDEEKLKNELVDLVENKNLERFVHILPPCADVHLKVLDAAMFVSSSDFEGLSNSMLEAMTIGLPCVCTDCLGGGAREMIQNGENGLLVPINDVTRLFEAMKNFIQNPELAAKCGQNAARIRTLLAADSIAAEWLNVVDRVVEK